MISRPTARVRLNTIEAEVANDAFKNVVCVLANRASRLTNGTASIPL
jgi:hypothetical protein